MGEVCFDIIKGAAMTADAFIDNVPPIFSST